MTGDWATPSCCLHGVAVRQRGDRVEVADTRRLGETLAFTVAEWGEFCAAIRAGEFNVDS